jgi:quinol monooxygenase YgiN
MFMRFIHIRVQPDRLPDFEQFFDRRIVGALREIDGCLFACLLSNPEHPSECISMTLWSDADAAGRYQDSGLYQKLLDEADPYLWHSNEWRVRLSDDLTLEYEQVEDPPAIEAYPVQTRSGDPEALGYASPNMYLRIVAGEVREGMLESFTHHYEEAIIPTLLATDGCRYAYLAKALGDSNHVVSITLWDSKAKADAYELHGEFRDIMRSAEPFISSVFQWRMTLESPRRSRETSSADVQIEGYHIVAGESFGA